MNEPRDFDGTPEPTFAEQHAELLAFMEKEAHWNEFFDSLTSQFAEKGYLTDKQVSSAYNTKLKCEAARDRRIESNPKQFGKFEKLVSIFNDVRLGSPVFRAEDLYIDRAKPNSANPGSLYVRILTADGGKGDYQGKIDPEGIFWPIEETEDWIREALTRIDANPTEVAREYGIATGQCSCCGRTLTNETSIKLGIGPICRAKWGI